MVNKSSKSFNVMITLYFSNIIVNLKQISILHKYMLKNRKVQKTRKNSFRLKTYQINKLIRN